MRTPWKLFIGMCWCLCILATSCTNKSDIFIANNGSDINGTGSKCNPFASLKRAKEEIVNRKKNDEDTKSYHVFFREGKYALRSTFRLTNEDDLEGLNLVFSAYKNEAVSLTGGIEIAAEKAEKLKDENVIKRFDAAVRNHIRVVDLKSQGIYDYGKLRPVGFARPFGPAWAELFVNGEPFSLARWPNDSTIAMGKIVDSGSVPRDGDFSNRGGKFTFDTNRPQSWKSHEDIWISGYFKRGWAEDAVELAQIDTANKVFETKQPSLYGFGTGMKFNRWFVYNILEEVDQPGEFYLDRKEGKLYFYPHEIMKKLEISILETPMVSIIDANNIRFENITFECSRGMGIYIENSNNIHVDNCTFRNLGMMAVCMGQGIVPFKNLSHNGIGVRASEKVGSYLQHVYDDTVFDRRAGQNNVVDNCKIYNTGAGGIHLSGGDRKTLKPGNNAVINCKIHNFNRIEKSYRAGIDISGVGNRIANCELFDAPSMAILMRGNDHLFEYNEIHHVCQEVHDQGALYYGRDPSERGHLVRYNFFHHLNSIHATSAVYHDDGACGMKVFGNIFYKPGEMPVLIGGGTDNPYSNNIFIDAELGIHVDNRNSNWSKNTLVKGGVYDVRLKAVNYQQPPYSTRYPELAKYWDDDPALPKRNTVSKNVFYKVKKAYRHNKAWMPFEDDNWLTEDNPGFVDEESMNFKLKKDARVFSEIEGFEDIPFEKIGYKNPADK
ncbi:right-handed parallel beta-helix repeat-containing protein [Puteibacter caeruleilacunae]|nr:right-handed parallel beta-helix repeat-containing protein [Puteibacter caeruleilacunae]